MVVSGKHRPGGGEEDGDGGSGRSGQGQSVGVTEGTKKEDSRTGAPIENTM